MHYKLFVYGTLKQGYCNHHYLQNAIFLGNATTLYPYPMIAPKKIYSYLIDIPGKGKRVQGELYEVDLRTLKQVDRLEEVPRYYFRAKIEVKDEQGNVHEAYTYFVTNPPPFSQRHCLEKF